MEMSMPRVEEDDGEQRRRRKLEEALEVKSLRRIISAYLKYAYFSNLFLILFNWLIIVG